MLCRATHDGQVMVESSDKMWSIGEDNGKPLQYSCLRTQGAQYATGDPWRNNSRKNEGMEQKHYPVVDVTDDRSKI